MNYLSFSAGIYLTLSFTCTVLLRFCQAPFFYTSFSTKKSFSNRCKPQPGWPVSWGLAGLWFCYRIWLRVLSPVESVHWVSSEKKVPGNRGGRSRNFVLFRVTIAVTSVAIKAHFPKFTLSLTQPPQAKSLSCNGSPTFRRPIRFFPQAKFISRLACNTSAPPRPLFMTKNAFLKLTNFKCFSLARFRWICINSPITDSSTKIKSCLICILTSEIQQRGSFCHLGNLREREAGGKIRSQLGKIKLV